MCEIAFPIRNTLKTLFEDDFWLVLGSSIPKTMVLTSLAPYIGGQRNLKPKSGIYRSMQFFMLFQNMASKRRKKNEENTQIVKILRSDQILS